MSPEIISDGALLAPVPTGRRTFQLRAILLTALGGLLIWQVLTRSLAAYLALTAPATALKLRSDEPTALMSLAEAQLNPVANDKGDGLATTEKLPTPTGSEQSPIVDAGESQWALDRLGGLAEVAFKALFDKLAGGQKSSIPINPALTPQDLDRIRAEVGLALCSDPLNARALRMLAQLDDAAHDEVQATRLMRAAAEHSKAESLAMFWMLQKSFDNKDYAQVTSYADIFLRKRPQLVDLVVPMLARLAESGDPAALKALTETLASNPPWRSAFFAALLSNIKDARTPLNLLLSVKASSSPPASADIGGYLNFLIGHKFYELAYYTWLQFLSTNELSRVGLLTNGSFETAPSGLPFDWVIAPGSGVTVDIAPLPDTPDGHGLFLELGPGQVEFGNVTQMLFLSHGTYLLKGKIKGELNGQRGLQWRVLCAGGASESLGESPMFVGVAPAWIDIEVQFSVPEKDCRAQQLRLDLAARSASEQLVSGSIWYDDLQIVKAPEAAKDAGVAPDKTKDAAITPETSEESAAVANKGHAPKTAPDNVETAHTH